MKGTVRRWAKIIPCFFLAGCLTPTLKNNLALEYYNLGNAYFSINKYSEAVQSYQKALLYNPDLAEGSFNLARVYFALGRYEEGIALLRQLQTAKGENLFLLQMMGYGLAQLNQKDEAIHYYLRALELSEGNANTLYNLGVLYYEKAQYELSFNYLRLLHEINSADPVALKLLGKIESQRGRAEEALQFYLYYLKQKPEDLDVGLEAYRMFAAQKQYSEALNILDLLLSKKKEHPQLWFEKAFILLAKAEDRKGGIEALEKALTLGFKDKQRFRVLLVEAPSSYLEEIVTLLSKTGAFPKEEWEEFLKTYYSSR